MNPYSRQQDETTTPNVSSKLEEDRAERFSPHESPHSFHTEEDLAAFIFSHQPEGIRRKIKIKAIGWKETK
jgi:hypothetical protein